MSSSGRLVNGKVEGNEILDGIRNETIASAQNEVLSIRKVLVIQQEENERYRKHNVLLSAEIDGLRVIVEKKQKQINQLTSTVSNHEYSIQSLEQKIVDITVDTSAIKEYADQNTMLLGKFEKLKKEKDTKIVEIGKLCDETHDLKEIARKKAQALLQSEAGLITDLNKTNEKLIAAVARKNAAEDEMNVYKERSGFLLKNLKQSEDTRIAQVERSRQSEYRTLKRTEELLESLRKVESDKEQVGKTLELATYRGDKLQESLIDALDEVDESKNLAMSAIERVENIGGSSRLRERLMQKEIESLKLELDHSKRTVKELFSKTSRLEESVKMGSKGAVGSRRQNASANSNSISTIDKKSSTFARPPARLHLNSPRTPRDDFIALDSSISDGESLYVPSQLSSLSISATGAGAGKGKLPSPPSHVFDTLTVSASADVDLRPDGRQRLLLNYVETFASLLSRGENGASLHLARCGLLDDDLLKLLDRLRYISLSTVQSIDLRGNQLTDAGADYITTWLLGLKGSDFTRPVEVGPILIDIRDNDINAASCDKAVMRIREAKRPEVKHCDILDVEGRYVLGLYGPTSGSISDFKNVAENGVTGLLFRVDYGRPVAGSRSLSLSSVKAGSSQSQMKTLPIPFDDDVDSQVSSLIPRNRVMRGAEYLNDKGQRAGGILAPSSRVALQD